MEFSWCHAVILLTSSNKSVWDSKILWLCFYTIKNAYYSEWANRNITTKSQSLVPYFFRKHLAGPNAAMFDSSCVYSVIDFSRFDGVYNPCAGSVTPWTTHLGSEEGDPDGKVYLPENVETWKLDEDVLPWLQYKGLNVSDPAAIDNDEAIHAWKPYKYGHIWEVALRFSSSWVHLWMLLASHSFRNSQNFALACASVKFFSKFYNLFSGYFDPELFY